jgi:hypothetical protein
MEDQGLHFAWLLPFDQYGMGGPSRNLCFSSIALWVIRAWKPPLCDEAVVLEEAS